MLGSWALWLCALWAAALLFLGAESAPLANDNGAVIVDTLWKIVSAYKDHDVRLVVGRNNTIALASRCASVEE